tara:strand:- start:1897 stop:2106 length:210 start_codon:yes stop_codon:yes gene_type:complete
MTNYLKTPQKRANALTMGMHVSIEENDKDRLTDCIAAIEYNIYMRDKLSSEQDELIIELKALAESMQVV